MNWFSIFRFMTGRCPPPFLGTVNKGLINWFVRQLVGSDTLFMAFFYAELGPRGLLMLLPRERHAFLEHMFDGEFWWTPICALSLHLRPMGPVFFPNCRKNEIFCPLKVCWFEMVCCESVTYLNWRVFLLALWRCWAGEGRWYSSSSPASTVRLAPSPRILVIAVACTSSLPWFWGGGAALKKRSKKDERKSKKVERSKRRRVGADTDSYRG